MKLILASTQDPAAKNITARLLEIYDFERSPTSPNTHVYGNVTLVTIAGGVTQLTGLPIDADEVIVASRHASESGTPSLTIHAPGEPSRLELAMASPPTIKSALKALERTRDELKLTYDVSLEATHHGPTRLEVPVTFVEIGSSLEQWRDEKAGEAVARAIMTAATSTVKCRRAVGLGGPHYAPRHTEVVLRTDVGVGHILPKYVSIDEALLERAIVRTRGGIELLAIDWKGLSGEQRQISQRVASRLGIQAMRTREILSQAKV
jgi:D-aminoacyl-tRNA deacylase